MGKVNKPWTDDEIQKLHELANSNMSINEIAEELGRTFNSTKEKLRYLKIRTKSSERLWTDKEIDKLKQLAYKKLTYKEIAEYLGKSQDSIKYICRKHRIEIYKPIKQWSTEDIEKLRELVESDVAIEEISKILNRTVQAIAYKIRALGMQLNVPGRKWNKDSEELLRELWVDENKTLSYIAKRLNRSENAIKVKAKSIGLISRDRIVSDLTITEVAFEMGVDRQTVQNWIKNKGLPSKKTQISYAKYQINIDELLKWLKNNQSVFNASTISKYLFTNEPEWLKEKRIRDSKGINKQHKRFWTARETNMMLSLIKLGRSWEYIGDKLNRTPLACQMKAIDLGYTIFRPTIWQQDELDILRKYASTSTLDELTKLLPKRSAKGIFHKIKELGLTYKYTTKSWSENEVNILKENAKNMTLDQLAELLPNRTDKAIQIKLQKLKLSYIKRPKRTSKNKE